MKTIIIVTPSNIEVEYRLAGIGSRLAAFVVDFILQILMILTLLFTVWFFSHRIFEVGMFDGVSLSVILIGGFIIYFGYFIVCELRMNGQTPGKKIFGLRTIRENGQPIEFTQSLIRGLIRSSVDVLYIGVFVVMFHPRHKRLGDLAAGTVVVSEKYDGFLSPTENSYSHEWPEFLPAAMDMTLPERQIVEEWLRRRENFNDGGELIAQKLKEYFGAKPQLKGMYDDESIVNQYQPTT